MPAPDEEQVHGVPASPEGEPRTRWWLHIVLFVATCATTFFAGGVFSGTEEEPFSIGSGLMFSASIMGILLFHEMAHFIAARRHRVNASLPYFIPVPLPPIGTFGAIIRMRQPPRTRASLLDIGCAGPLAGLVVTVAVCLLGLELSEVRSLAEIPRGAWMEGNSLLYLALKKIAHPEMGPQDDVFLHPVAWAGWLGLLVTSLNLLPAGQLDGGHVLYAMYGPRTHQRVGRAVHVAVFLMGMVGLGCHLALLNESAVQTLGQAGLLSPVLRGSGMLPWLLWTVLLRFVGGRHPPVGDPGTPLSSARESTGFITLLVFVLTFTPVVGSPLET